MKKIVLLSALSLMAAGFAFAQKKPKATTTTSTITTASPVTTASIAKPIHLKINEGALETTSPAVKLDIKAENAMQMMISSQADFSGAHWTAYAEKFDWQIWGPSGSSIAVYVKFRDKDGKESAAINSSIILKTN